MKKPFHPFLIAAYFVLELLALNLDQVRVSAAWRALGFSLLAAAVLFGLLRLATRDWQRAALLSSLFLLLFFTYGHVYQYLEAHLLFGIQLGRHRLLLPLWLLAAGLGTWWSLTRPPKSLALAAQAVNLFAAVALLFPFVQVVSFVVRTASLSQAAPATGSGLQVTAGQARPDVYYIILDGYSRPDVLQAQLGFDDSDFIQQLEGLGFTVARCSQSNYAQTQLSLASSLNMDYLDALGDDFVAGSADMSPTWPLIQHSAVRRAFEELGYTIVAFETGYYWTHWDDADVYYSQERSAVNQGEARLAVNGFEAMLVRSSAALLLTDAGSFLPQSLTPDLDYPNREHRERVLYTLDKLRSLPLAVQSPKFIYAHIVAPHFPIVFGPQGELVSLPEDLDDAAFAQAHTDEIRYINQRILEILQEILAVSATPPIIILQADHGNDRALPADRTSILNAYYLPGEAAGRLYPTITPVNTFRLVLDAYFGAQLELLPDESFYSSYEQPYDFTLIPNDCDGDQ